VPFGASILRSREARSSSAGNEPGRKENMMRMKKTGLVLVTGVALAAGVLLSLPGNVAAQIDGAGRLCTNGTLRGNYGFLLTGVRAVPPPLGGGTEMVVATGVRQYDGNGNFADSSSGLHGQITGVTPDLGGSVGTYVVNPDCTGTSSISMPWLPFPIEQAFVIVDNGRQVKEAVMSPLPNVVSVILDRQ
jgi:hypothetical protein